MIGLLARQCAEDPAGRTAVAGASGDNLRQWNRIDDPPAPAWTGSAMTLYRCRIQALGWRTIIERSLRCRPEHLVECVRVLVEELDEFDLVEVFDPAGQLVLQIVSNDDSTRH